MAGRLRARIETDGIVQNEERRNEQQGFDFNKAMADADATISPLVVVRAGMIKRVHEGVADYLAANPQASATTEPNADVEAALRRSNQKIREAGEKVHGRHKSALETAGAEEGRASAESGRAFLGALERFETFQESRRRFEARCGVSQTPSVQTADLRLALLDLISRIERAIAPRPVPAPRASGETLTQRIRELVGG